MRKREGFSYFYKQSSVAKTKAVVWGKYEKYKEENKRYKNFTTQR